MLPSEPIFQCTPNFSEGRSNAVIEGIALAINATSGALLIDYSADPDHNRCVMTILGSEEAILFATVAAARVAVGAIDMRSHIGLHPRLGAVDIVPVVPLRGAGMADAIAVAEAIASALAGELALPVYFYERNARPGREAALPALRRGGFEAIHDRPLTGARTPDLGPARAHATAGAAIVGARGPLAAYNINILGGSEAAAREIAAAIRHDRKTNYELAGVRALGLFLPSRCAAQVSMNLTLPDRTPLPAVFEYVARHAARLGYSSLESEIVGAIPGASLGGQSPESICWRDYRATQILETWLGARTTASPASA